jgi:hypothetical protein
VAIELAIYTRKKRQVKHNLKLEVTCLRIEIAQLQHRHNALIKAVLALSQGVSVTTSVCRGGKNISSATELDFINAALDNPVDDDFEFSVEREVEDLLKG